MCSSDLELRQAHDNLFDSIEAHLLETLGLEQTPFERYQSDIQNRYINLKEHLLFPRQKTFLNRVKLPLSDRNAWINSLAQTLLSKQLTEFSDEEAIVLNDRLTSIFKELDDLLILSTVKFDNEKQQAMSIEITGSDNLKIKKKDRKSTRLNSSHLARSRMPSSA